MRGGPFGPPLFLLHNLQLVVAVFPTSHSVSAMRIAYSSKKVIPTYNCEGGAPQKNVEGLSFTYK